uniref:Uncharacterized protein n=1 Tax=Phlebotomus papatasi TaxID=29031 RepID=A0A1B0F020_PHLPP
MQTGGYLTVQDAPYNTPLGIAFLQAGEEMGYDIVDVNGEQQTGFALYQFTMRRGTRCSAAKAFIFFHFFSRKFKLIYHQSIKFAELIILEKLV